MSGPGTNAKAKATPTNKKARSKGIIFAPALLENLSYADALRAIARKSELKDFTLSRVIRFERKKTPPIGGAKVSTLIGTPSDEDGRALAVFKMCEKRVGLVGHFCPDLLAQYVNRHAFAVFLIAPVCPPIAARGLFISGTHLVDRSFDLIAD